MTNSTDKISKPVKILGLINLASILLAWMPLAPWDKGSGFRMLDNLVTSIFLLWLFFSLQGGLVFIRKIGKWDKILASIIIFFSVSFWIIFNEFRFLIAAAPMIIYLTLQLKSAGISNNFKLAYLNIWNIVILTYVLLEFWKK